MTEKVRAILISTDARVFEVHAPKEITGRCWQAETIACDLVDCVSLSSQIDMWIDDDGLYTQPVNPLATRLARHYGLTWQNYHGPVVLCGVDSEGDSISLTDDQFRALLVRLADITS